MKTNRLKKFLLVVITALLILPGLLASFSSHKVYADSPSPATPIKWADVNHSSATDASGNVYKPLGYACIYNSPNVTNSQGTAIASADKPGKDISVEELTETTEGVRNVNVPSCREGGKTEPAQYVFAVSGSPAYLLVVYPQNGSKNLNVDAHYCPVGPSTCTAAVFKVDSHGNTGQAIISNSKIGTMTYGSGAGVIPQPVTPVTPCPGGVKADADGVCPTSSSPSTDSNDCGNANTKLSWIICPIYNVVESGADELNNIITTELKINTCSTFGNNDTTGGSCSSSAPQTSAAYKGAWSSMRNIALIFIVIAGLVMVIAQAIGSQAIDAYTVRSVLPRLLIAAIAIALSWILLQALVDFTNILGEGVRALIYSPFNSLNQMHGGNGMTGAAGAGGAILDGVGAIGVLTGGIFLAVSSGVLLSFAGSLAIGLLIGFLVVVLRQIVVTFLIIMAPVAIAAYCLPNTQKLFHTWWDWLFRGLLMFPIIIGFIAAGRVFSLVSLSQTNGNGGNDVLFSMVAIVAYIIPFFLLPFTFKLAGGAVGGIAQGLHSAGNKPRAWLRKRGVKGMANTFHDARTGNRWKGGNDNNFRGRLNRIGARAANLDKLSANPRQWRSDIRTATAGHASTEIENAMKDSEYNEWSGDDTVNRAASESHDATSLRAALLRYDPQRFRDPGELRDTVAQVERQRRKMSTSAFRQLTTQQALAGGTAYNDYVDSAGVFHSGTGEAWAAVAAAGAGDSAATARLVKNGRQSLMQAGRVDQGGAGFGATIGAVREIQDAMSQGVSGRALQNVINNAGTAIEDSAIDSSPAGQAVYGKPASARALAKAHRRKIDNIMRSVSTGQAIDVNGEHRVATERDLKQAMASAAGIYDTMATAAPQNAREFADGLTGLGLVVSNLPQGIQAAVSPGGGNVSMIQAFDNMRGVDADFAEMRRDFGASTDAAAAAAAAAGAPQPGAAGPPPGGPPIAPGAPGAP